jgi:hypothetical protein
VPNPNPCLKVDKLTQNPPNKKPYLLRILSLLTFLSLLLSCQNEQCTQSHNLKEYYFPIPDGKEAKVYQYSSTLDTLLTKIYWHVSRGEGDRILFLQFDERWQPRQIAQEKILPSGVLQEKIFFSQEDSLSARPSFYQPRILHSHVFPFCANAKGGIYLYALEWEEADKPEYQYALYRNRRFMGDTTLTIPTQPQENRVYFMVKDLLEIHLRDQGYSQPEMTTLEYYQKGIGLVQYTKYMGEEPLVEYQLDTIFNAESFYKTKGIIFEKWEEEITSLLH